MTGRHARALCAGTWALLASFPVLPADVATGLAAFNQLCRRTIDTGDYNEAARICKRVNFNAAKLAPASVEHVASIANMGDIKALEANFVDADALYANALRLVDDHGGADSAAAAALLERLVEFKVKRGKYLDAQVLAKRVLSMREKVAGVDDVGVAVVRVRYADMLAESHQFQEAEAAYRQAISVLARGAPGRAVDHARAIQHLAELYERRGQYQKAEVQYLRLAEMVDIEGLGAAQRASALQRLAYVCHEQDRQSEAAACTQRAADLVSATDTPLLRQ